jgi:hypothetical protein
MGGQMNFDQFGNPLPMAPMQNNAYPAAYGGADPNMNQDYWGQMGQQGMAQGMPQGMPQGMAQGQMGQQQQYNAPQQYGKGGPGKLIQYGKGGPGKLIQYGKGGAGNIKY